MTADEVLETLRPLGQANYKRILASHGIPEPCLGVKIEELKKLQKRLGGRDHQLALALYDTGVYDAMYLAGLIADDSRMTKRDLQKWVKRATCDAVSEYVVPGVAAGSAHGFALAREWITSKQERIAGSGWTTWSHLVAITYDSELDLDELRGLLDHVAATIHDQPNRLRYTMNTFVISVGGYVKPLTAYAVKIAKQIGKVRVDMGGTSCKVPSAVEYIEKMKQRGVIGKKRKSAKC